MPIEEENNFIDQKDCRFMSSIFSTNPGYKMTNMKFSDTNCNGNIYSANHHYHFTDSSMIPNNNQHINQQNFNMNLVEHGFMDMCLDEFQYQESYNNQNNNNNPNTSGNGKILPYVRRANSICGSVTNGTNNNNHIQTNNGNIDFNTNVLSSTSTTTTPPNPNSPMYDSAVALEESRIKDLCVQEAQKLGFIVGDELEFVKSKSHRSVIQNTPDRIINCFKDRYGQVSDSNTKKAYLQLGVRVPSKEHVSEIVGKQGSKIKQIREKTGALITTPGEQEDHVFIIEAPPRTALHVAQILRTRAEDITLSRSAQHNQDARRRSSCPGGTASSNQSNNIITSRHHSITNTNTNTSTTSMLSNTNMLNSVTSGNNSPPNYHNLKSGGMGISSTNAAATANQTSASSHHHHHHHHQSSKIILASGKIQVPKIIVGRIIGTQGSIITTIQRDTGTEIRSPPKELGKPKNSLADFEILVYRTSTLNDSEEAAQRVSNAKQLIAHVAMHQLEKVRAEEAPYSNYQVQANSHFISTSNSTQPNPTPNDSSSSSMNHQQMMAHSNKEQLLSEQMRPFDWIWPDVDKLDECLAQEVVDRILEESKKKTKSKTETASSTCILYDKEFMNMFPGDQFVAIPATTGNNDSSPPTTSATPVPMGRFASCTPGTRFSLPENHRGSNGCSSSGMYSMLDPHPHHSSHQTHSSNGPGELAMLMMSNNDHVMNNGTSSYHHIHHNTHQQSEFCSNSSATNMSPSFLQQHRRDNMIHEGSSEFINSEFVENHAMKNVFNKTHLSFNEYRHQLMMNSASDISSSPSSCFYAKHPAMHNTNNGTSHYYSANDCFSYDNGFTWTDSIAMSTAPSHSTSNGNGISSVKSYADSVKPHLSPNQSNCANAASNSAAAAAATFHGTIGDHLKRTSQSSAMVTPPPITSGNTNI